EHRKLAQTEALHDLARVSAGCAAAVCIGENVPAVVDGRIGAAPWILGIGSAELAQDIWKLMGGVHRHDVIGVRAYAVGAAIEGVRFVTGESFHRRSLSADRVGSGQR